MAKDGKTSADAAGKGGAPAADEARSSPEDAAAAELGPFHGLEPTWLRDALTDILARLAKLEHGK